MIILFVSSHLQQLQVYSFEAATSPSINILPGSRAIDKRNFKDIENDLLLGLSLLEGSFPPAQLNPALKHFAHYVEFTMSHGPLRTFWMMCFER